eukprot:583293-Prorocentrum_lima.AAC.1
MPLRLVNECVSPLPVVHLLVVTVLYHSSAVWYKDGARRRVFVSSVCRGMPVNALLRSSCMMVCSGLVVCVRSRCLCIASVPAVAPTPY